MTDERSEYIRQWLFRADEDMAVINSLASQHIEHYTSSICFHAQQAVEKFLKAFLIYHDRDFPRTHDLDYLLEKCCEIDSAFCGIDLKSLTDYGVSVRYPDDFYVPEVQETKDYINIAKEIKQIVEERLST